MRAFVALDLPEALTDPLTRLQAGLRVGRPVAEENLHLTLAFLGELPEHRLDDLAEGLALLRLSPVELSLGGLDLFGPALAALARGEGLEALQARVLRAVREAGQPLERSRFRPHVTIARLPQTPSASESARLGEFLALNGTFAAGPAPALSLGLYRSHLRPEGPIYEPLVTLPLGGYDQL